MKLLYITCILFICSCSQQHTIDKEHVKNLAESFMKNTVIPAMPNPKPFAIVSEKVVTKTYADNINDYRFVYDHLSLNKSDSLINKARLDSVANAPVKPNTVISVTVNVGYKIKYKRGDIVTDSIKLGYDPVKDKVSYWPF